MANILGIDGKLYYDKLGAGSGTWEEVTLAKDVTAGGEKREADTSTRGSKFSTMKSTLKDVTLEFQIEYDPTKTEFTELRDAWLNNTVTGFAVVDGAIVPAAGITTQGFQFDGEVLTFQRSEELENSMKVDITVKPTNSTFATAWVSLTGV